MTHTHTNYVSFLSAVLGGVLRGHRQTDRLTGATETKYQLHQAQMAIMADG